LILRSRCPLGKSLSRVVAALYSHFEEDGSIRAGSHRIKEKVTEHRAEVKICIHSRDENNGKFPEVVVSAVKYGEGIKEIYVYLMQHKLISYKRSMKLIEDFLNHHISQGSISSFNKELYDKLEDVEKSIKNQLMSHNEVVHFDEALICINGKTK